MAELNRLKIDEKVSKSWRKLLGSSRIKEGCFPLIILETINCVSRRGEGKSSEHGIWTQQFFLVTMCNLEWKIEQANLASYLPTAILLTAMLEYANGLSLKVGYRKRSWTSMTARFYRCYCAGSPGLFVESLFVFAHENYSTNFVTVSLR